MKPVILAAAAIVALGLVGCSSASDDATSSPSPVATAEASPAVSEASPMASMTAPIIVSPDQTEVSATVGQFIDFNVGAKPGRWDIATDDPAVVSVTKGGKQDGAVFNPGAQALAVGTATVTLTDTESDLDALVYTITVTE